MHVRAQPHARLPVCLICTDLTINPPTLSAESTGGGSLGEYAHCAVWVVDSLRNGFDLADVVVHGGQLPFMSPLRRRFPATGPNRSRASPAVGRERVVVHPHEQLLQFVAGGLARVVVRRAGVEGVPRHLRDDIEIRLA